MNKFKSIISLSLVVIILFGIFTLFSTARDSETTTDYIAPPSFVLVSGTPSKATTLEYPVELMTLQNQMLGVLMPATSKTWNSAFIRTYHSENLLLLGRMPNPGKFEGKFYWLDNIRIQKSFTLTVCEACYYFSSFLLHKNDELIFMLVSSTGTANNIKFETKGYALNSGTIVELTLADLGFAQAYGMPGSSASSHDMLSGIFSSKQQATYGLNWRIELGWLLPDEFKSTTNEHVTQMINNRFQRVITSNRFYHTKEKRPFIELKSQNKKSEQWSSMVIDGNLPNLRAFGRWVATEQRMRVDNAGVSPPKIFLRQDKFLTADARAYVGRYRQSGKMTLINPIEKRTIKIDTNQPDSETLLVDNEKVYYRVNDELYSADIGQSSLENIKLMVKDKRIFDVHWMMRDKSAGEL